MVGNSGSRSGIQYSEKQDGSLLAPWRSIRIFSASKQCPICGGKFRPKPGLVEKRWNEQRCCSAACGNTDPMSWRQHGWKAAAKACKNCGAIMRPWTDGKKIQGEKGWNEQECCSQSCAKKYKNPMWKIGAPQKLSDTLRKIGHRPVIQGGNGRGLTKPQIAMLKILGTEWKSELAVRTYKQRGSGYPGCYKLDIANEKLKIGIEIDGANHVGRRQALDRKKDDLLVTLGWKVFRLKNKDALKMCSIFTSADILLTSLMAS